jgi:indole-3-glycerol phosphate synthase
VELREPHRLGAESVEDFIEMARTLAEREEIDAFEVNLSCPNVQDGKLPFATDPGTAARVIAGVKQVCHKPVWAKLSPNVTRISDMAKAVEAAGADAILIIMSAADDTLARELHACADQYGMSVLIEAHDEAELIRALGLPSALIGVNNRDLRRMATDLAVTERLADLVPDWPASGRILISESGVKTPADIARLRACGARGFLVGESLMRAENAAESVRALVASR